MLVISLEGEITDSGSRIKRIWSSPVAPLLWVCGEAVPYGSGYSMLPACFMVAEKCKDESESPSKSRPCTLTPQRAPLLKAPPFHPPSSLCQCRFLSVPVLTVQEKIPYPWISTLPHKLLQSALLSNSQMRALLLCPLLSCPSHSWWPCCISAHSSQVDRGHAFLESLQIS